MAAKYWPLKRDFKVILCSMMNGNLHLSSRITEFIIPFAKKRVAHTISHFISFPELV